MGLTCTCGFCQYTYHSEIGDPVYGLAPGTVPSQFPLGMCPRCHSQVHQFYLCFEDVNKYTK